MPIDAQKIDRLDRYLDKEALDSVWFARPGNFAWLTGGDNAVDQTNTTGNAVVGYDGDRVRVRTTTNEQDRFVAEELPAEVAVDAVEWHEADLDDLVRDAVSGDAAADFPVDGLDAIDAAGLRRPLTGREVERYRDIARETTVAVEAAARDATPDTSEHEGAAALAQELLSRGLHAPVLLVGGDDRAQRHRHFTPSTATLGDYAIYTVVAEREGLNVAVTRTVAFDAPDWLDERHDAAHRVAASAIAETAERAPKTTERAPTDESANRGGTAGDVFETIQESYETVGEPGEWRKHHQGGAIGYGSREWVATPDDDTPIQTPMAYAWNPTIQGAKAEETVLVTEDGEHEVLTTTGDWPTTEYTSTHHDRPVLGHDVLHLR